ncbi:GGDEF domain-containing protein [Simiduia aestuariiviva]|uniref:Diguanylate cyclase (GGDEF)-like protein n=1 Tax=Simiduia aestuariiviva TaxID=1510459 RepID=A0A839URC3_9GAMM|nr:GGDEF domain-containing protein [Simiduia aestuariiviva]MBB3169019.1 diguanylate cyclase (GGDEF)-like protein [Simiduia aestuariiviva]
MVLKFEKFNVNTTRPTINGSTTSRYKEDLLRDTIKILTHKVLGLERELLKALHFANHDLLTGLANRSLLRDRLLQAMHQANRQHKQVGLLILDLNGFKSINDTHGHNVGDEILIQVAKRLSSCIRAEDSAYRYGGDEFVILLPEVDGTSGANELRSKLNIKLTRLYRIGMRRISASASIGIAVYPSDGKDQKELIKHADENMYCAKTDGKGKLQNLPH